MKFEINVGTDYSTVKFHSWKVRPSAVESILNSLHKLGGKYQRKQDHWLFPSYITSEVIQEVIHNTCFVCGGLMQDSTAMVDQEFEFEHDIHGTVTQQVPGYAKQTKVRKCSSCGHSHT